MCTIELIISDITGKLTKFSPSEIGLVKKNNGEITAQAICIIPADINLNQNLDISITVTNSFGNKFTATKQWIVQK